MSLDIPEGWKLVPIKPTDEMLSVYKHYYRKGQGYMDITIWKEMLACAPEPPA